VFHQHHLVRFVAGHDGIGGQQHAAAGRAGGHLHPGKGARADLRAGRQQRAHGQVAGRLVDLAFQRLHRFGQRKVDLQLIVGLKRGDDGSRRHRLPGYSSPGSRRGRSRLGLRPAPSAASPGGLPKAARLAARHWFSGAGRAGSQQSQGSTGQGEAGQSQEAHTGNGCERQFCQSKATEKGGTKPLSRRLASGQVEFPATSP
nr:hypothetical protein [Tanacetum cinerariifolium]